MDDFEARLKGLRLRTPSAALDRRVLTASARSPCVSRKLPLWVAAAASFAMAVAGFAAGAWWRDGCTPRNLPVTAYVICDAPAGRNPFDFTRASDPMAANATPVFVHTTTGG
jgi:hypothetical protein